MPGGKASYPSTVLMNAIPAKIAGVKKIVMITPPDKYGKKRSPSFLTDRANSDTGLPSVLEK